VEGGRSEGHRAYQRIIKIIRESRGARGLLWRLCASWGRNGAFSMLWKGYVEEVEAEGVEVESGNDCLDGVGGPVGKSGLVVA
jgi:hypothetical protein